MSSSPQYSPTSPVITYHPVASPQYEGCVGESSPTPTWDEIIAHTEARRERLKPAEDVLRQVKKIAKDMGVKRQVAAKCLVHIAQNHIPVLPSLPDERQGFTFREIDQILTDTTKTKTLDYYMADDNTNKKDIEKCRHILETQYNLTFKTYKQ